MRVQVFPKSSVRYSQGVMSPNVCRSNAAYAVPGSRRLASTHDTQLAFGRPGTLPTTLVQCPPPSRVSCTLPSSVPTQMVFASRGDLDDALLRGAGGDGRVPVEAQLLLVARLRLDVARGHRAPIDAANESSLRLDVDRLVIG